MKFKRKSFGECAQLIREPYTPSEDENHLYVGLEHIEQQTLRLNGVGSSMETISNKFRFRRGDILFGKLRPYFRKVVVPDFDGVCSTDIFVVRAKEGTDQRFLFYWIASEDFIRYATAGSEGTKMPRAKWEFLERLEKDLPVLEEQQRIGEILGALDDKIEFNVRMNKTLEAMAAAIFKSWFIDFEPFQDGEFIESKLGPIPKGWEVSTIEGLARVTSGKRPLQVLEHPVTEPPIPVYGGAGAMGYTLEPLFDEQVIVTGRVGTLGKVHRVPQPSWPSDNTLVVLAKDETFYEFLFFYMRLYNFETLNRGTSNPLITQRDIKRQELVVPPSEIVERFSEECKQLLNLVDRNIIESRTLAQIRDTLLPKLLSGEVRAGQNL